MIEVQNLSKHYQGIPAVSDVSFHIAPGEILGYLGPNGSGKSTTVKMLTGLIEPTRGRLLWEGRDIRDDLTGFRRILGYVPEEALVYPYLSGLEYLQLTGRLRGLPERVIGEKSHALLDLFSLHEHRHSAIGSYSKGMKQKVLIIAALLHDPRVLLFDEPLSGLDVTAAMVFKGLVRRLAARGRVLLYSSHVLEVVEKVCSRVLILRKGQVAACDEVARLRQMLVSPSLEDVFAQLVQQEDTESIAGRMSDVIRG